MTRTRTRGSFKKMKRRSKPIGRRWL